MIDVTKDGKGLRDTTFDGANEFLSYDSEDGSLRRRVSRGGVTSGSVVGCTKRKGGSYYNQIRVEGYFTTVEDAASARLDSERKYGFS